jgi:hypothetical protein
MGSQHVPNISVKYEDTQYVPAGSGSVDFGVVQVDTDHEAVINIENAGGGPLHISDVYLASGQTDQFGLDLSATSPVLPPGSATSFTLGFEPTLVGPQTAVVVIETNDPDTGEYSFEVKGCGSAIPVPDIDLLHGSTYIPNGTGIYFFGHVQEGHSRTETFTIENNGTAPLIVHSIAPTSGDMGDFIVGFSMPPVPPGSSDTFTITFSPTWAGDKLAVITVSNNAPGDDPYTFRVEGMAGLPPVVDIELWEGATYYPEGSSFSGFGTVTVGSSSAPVRFTIWNNGPDDLVIQNIEKTGGNILEFDLDLTFTSIDTPLPPGAGTIFYVTFDPLSSGSKWLDLDMNYNDPIQTPYRIRLEGEGED